MKAIKTSTTNGVLKGYGDNVFDLPVTNLTYSDGVHAVESCWELSAEEIEEVKRTGRIYFTCLGRTHPPIMLDTHSAVEEE